MAEQPNERATSADFEFAALDKAVNYRAALLREFAPSLKGRVVEVGSGIGQITAGIAGLPEVSDVVGVEPEPKFCDRFRALHPDLKVINGTTDALGEDFNWNALVCINVLEHIGDDLGALKSFRDRLAPKKGHLCLFVPARAEIYAPLDKHFGHFRRYHKPQLRDLLKDAGFEIVRLDYFNLVGYFAWWLNFKILKRRSFEVHKVRFYDRAILPVCYFLESRILRPPFGQSLIVVARSV